MEVRSTSSCAPWWEPIERELGPIALFDAHTHFGRNDPDGYRQEPTELLAAMELAGARAVVFPMHEPDGYPPANDAVLGRRGRAPDGGSSPSAGSTRTSGALAEARRCLDAGARGIKLHPRAEQFAMRRAGGRASWSPLAHERRVPVLIHAGPRDPGARARHGRRSPSATRTRA